ncbi:MaoC/PaaZ C-terminal domain-containing protein [Bosea sp. ASV33]|uniref:MaoC/PaaZ C-terminal domain-containing protein n=1 Tax=Bosea sp. ASV33 TaxID=2795106 RepID=UPI0018EB2094|nr:MaoC/PaaZ C-terminal domain-containing protein [Bosea sp. ASV33]
MTGAATTFDPARLLAYPIPEVEQSFTAKDTILYALSIGLGQDPLDEQQLRYLDHHRALAAVPSQAVVLGYPGFWIGNPATGVDPRCALHGEQEIALHRPLPVSGWIVGKTRITSLIDKGPGKAALLYTERRIVDAESGALIATTSMSHFLRGCGGFGGPDGPVPPVHAVPTAAPDLTIELTTRPEQALLYRLNGDDNPLHADPKRAAEAGFSRPILHGLCTFGVICHAVLRGLLDYDAARLKRMKLRFSAPVYPGETIAVDLWRDGSFQARVPERDVLVATNGLAVTG